MTITSIINIIIVIAEFNTTLSNNKLNRKIMSNNSNNLVHLYRQLLRASEKYPSKNKLKIYQSIREEFRENKIIDCPEKTRRKIDDGYHGLQRLRQFSQSSMSSSTSSALGHGTRNPNDWSVDLGKNVPSWFKPRTS